MKTEELMIGDWVMYDEFIDKSMNHPIKIIHLDRDSVAVKRYYPIPLTPEILEKNGFEYKEGETGMYGVTTASHYLCKGVPFEVFCDGEPFAIWFKEPVNIKFVHELQRALRFSKTNKDIVL